MSMYVIMNALMIFASLFNMASCIKTLYMSDICSSSLFLKETGEESTLRMFFSRRYPRNVEINCSLTVSTRVGSLIVVSIKKFMSLDLCRQYLEITSGESKFQYCTSFKEESGIGLDSNAFVLKDNKINLNVILGKMPKVLPSFDIILTSAKPAPCDSGTYSCNSGLCIWDRLECNNMNNCGDNSDEIAVRDRGSCDHVIPVSSNRSSMYIAIFVFLLLLVVILCTSGLYCLTKTVKRRIKWNNNILGIQMSWGNESKAGKTKNKQNMSGEKPAKVDQRKKLKSNRKTNTNSNREKLKFSWRN